MHTSLTIAIGDPEHMVAQAHAAAGFTTLKVKLGFDGDLELAERLARELPGTTFRYDANEGWDRERAARSLERWPRCNAELVEQPLPAADPDDRPGCATARRCSCSPTRRCSASSTWTTWSSSTTASS